MRRLGPLLALVLAGPALAQGDDAAAALNDYPTEARADYVFACMAVNAQTQVALRQCSCAIDHIASVLPYEGYVEAETILAMQQAGGPRSELFRDNEVVRGALGDLRRAQAEAEIFCF